MNSWIRSRLCEVFANGLRNTAWNFCTPLGTVRRLLGHRPAQASSGLANPWVLVRAPTFSMVGCIGKWEVRIM
jgi:hypothetical protein